MSAIPHPAWCSLERCSATDVDGAGAHKSRLSELHVTGSFPLLVVTDLYRVDSVEFGQPWIGIALRGSAAPAGEALLTVEDTRRLGRLLLDLADEAEQAERGAAS